MSQAFGWSVDDIEKAVVGLIQSGEIKGRVDSQSKVRGRSAVDFRVSSNLDIWL